MISFIVIGRNEEQNLENCFNAILKAIKFNRIIEYEIIYVDSKSTDSSIRIAQSFQEIKIFSVTGYCNAAIGRNIGAKESEGDVLFFIDGDMEIEKDFLSLVLDDDMNLKYDIVSGQVLNITDGLKSKCYPKMFETSQVFITQLALGGVFLIKRENWEAVNGMRTKFNTGEESDLGYRLIDKGFLFTFRKEIITIHNTDKITISHLWKMIFNKKSFYPRCVFYRDHFNKKNTYYAMWELDKTFILLSTLLILVLFLPNLILMFSIIYFSAVLLRSYRQVKGFEALKFIPFFIVSDFLNLIFLFSFFPKNKELQYMKIEPFITSLPKEYKVF